MIPHAPHILLALGLIGPGSPSDTPQFREQPTATECGLSLATRAGLPRHEAEVIVQQLRTHSVVQTDEFMRYLYALAYTESRFRQYRRIGADRLTGVPLRSEKGAIGIMQVTPDAAEHIHMIRRTVGMRPGKVTDKRLAQLEYNVNIGSAYLVLALTESQGDWIGALVMYNSGYYGLTRLHKGATVPIETAQYVTQILHLVSTCGVR